MLRTLPILFLVLIQSIAWGQNPLANGTLELTMATSGGTTNRSGVGYNPNQQLYYSVNAGSSGYNIETYDVTGASLASTTQGFDYRGCWWNPNTSALEGNGYSNYGIWIQDLDGSFYPLSTGVNAVPSTSGPDAQSCGDYDYVDDEILYYNGGTLYRYARATNTMITSVAVTGLPVATGNLNGNSVCYTNVPGMEAGVYDYVNQAFYFIDKITGQYQTTCQLPAGAPAASLFQIGFENGVLFIYGSNQWNGYRVVELCSESTSTLMESVCASYLSPSGNTYTATGVYSDTIPNAAGCDSIITIDLAVMNTAASITETACDTYTSPGGVVYNTSGVYMDTIPNAAGCDSLISIDLTIVPNTIDNSVTQTGIQLLANQLVAAYQWLDCDNGYQPIPGAVNQVYEPSVTGNYAVEVTMGTCSVISDCHLVDFTGLDELDLGLTIYPNPASEILYIDGLESLEGLQSVHLTDLSGKDVVASELNYTNFSMDVSNLTTGLYILNVVSETGSQHYFVVKQ